MFQVMFVPLGADSLEPHLDALQPPGCGDEALIGPAGDGTFIAEFDRDARASRGGRLGAGRVELGAARCTAPARRAREIVSLSAIAARTGRSDESVRLLFQGRRGLGGSPPPAGRINEKTQVWRWADVARWFTDALGEPPAGNDPAAFLAALNYALDLSARAVDLRERPGELEAVARFLPEELTAA